MSLKFKFAAVASLSLLMQSGLVFAKANVEQEFFVNDPQHRLVDVLKAYPELTFDHASAQGYEVYGPKGTEQILEKTGANFWDIKLSTKDFADYPAFPQFEQAMRDLQAKYPTIMKLFSVGKSSQGRDLWMMKISDNVNVDEVEPEVKYISSMHGDEITGRELMLRFMDELGTKYNAGDADVKALIDNTEVFIMPSMNPDGSEARTRANGRSADLNRDFPDFSTSDNQNTPAGREPETQAIMAFQDSRNFVLSANFHGGAEVVNYPWDTQAELFPFDNLIKGISLGYANLVPYIHNSTSFTNGVTNGYEWYEVNGGMQDWSYNWYDDLQVTIELSATKWPSFSEIPNFYAENKAALFYFLNSAHRGAGFSVGRANVNGTVQIFAELADGTEKDLGSYNFRHSEFYKILEDGNYKFRVSAQNQAGVDSVQEFTTTVGSAGFPQPNGNYHQISL